MMAAQSGSSPDIPMLLNMLGAHGFGSFYRNKRPVLSHVDGTSAAETNPGNIENGWDIVI